MFEDPTLPPAGLTAPGITEPVLRTVYVGRELRFDDVRLRTGRTTLGRTGDIAFSDPRTSRQHAELWSSDDRVLVKNLSSFGTFVNGVAVEEHQLQDGDVLRLGDSFAVLRWMPANVIDVQIGELRGRAPSMREVRHQVKASAKSRAMVLITGETGTGKELVCRALHRESGRSGPLVALNCAAIPEELAESQLFGHKAGAFTGATRDHAGYFRDADGGTLFLDELGELSPALQPKLLRALDEGRVTPVGATQSVPVDVRVVCATNRDLAVEVAAQRFRADLFARVAELRINLPPLRERREDVLLLLSSFLGPGTVLTPHLAGALLLHRWPFNVRELLKLAAELKVKGEGQEEFGYRMVADRLPDAAEAVAEPSAANAEATAAPPPPSREQLRELLIKHGGRVSRIAEECKRSRMQVYRWLEAHDLDADAFRTKG